jgi:hypothetical protein
VVAYLFLRQKIGADRPGCEPRRDFVDSAGTDVVVLRIDVFPTGWARGLATVESFIGALLMAYFVSVLSCRAIG